jgi:hypothetical protein
MKILQFPKDEQLELENYSESVTFNGSLTNLEDEVEQTTIWRKMIPTKEKSIYITTKIEKLANEEMVIMYNFMDEHFQGRLYRKPRDIEEFAEDLMIYFEKGQTRRYDQNWEDRLYKTLARLDSDREWMRRTTKNRIKKLH